jgi:hypothetical protein
MVDLIKFRFNFYQCKECGHVYKDRNLAVKCEEYCKENNIPSKEIIKKGIRIRR